MIFSGFLLGIFQEFFQDFVSVILSGTSLGILSRILLGIPAVILAGIPAVILVGFLSGILVGILAGIFFLTSDGKVTVL